jgi:hypothetical protein
VKMQRGKIMITMIKKGGLDEIGGRKKYGY